MTDRGGDPKLEIREQQARQNPPSQRRGRSVPEPCTRKESFPRYCDNNQEEAEKTLSKSRVEDADLILVKGYPEASENPLGDDDDHRDHGKPADPASAIFQEGRGRQNQCEEADTRGNQAVGVFPEDPPDPLRVGEEEHVVPVGRRPVRNGHPGTLGGHERPDHDEQEGGNRKSNGDPMHPGNRGITIRDSRTGPSVAPRLDVSAGHHNRKA